MEIDKVLDCIYMKSPIWIQNIATSFYGLGLYKQRYIGKYKRYLRQFKKQMKLDLSILKDIQNKEFMSILSYARENCSFYRDFYKDVDFNRIRSVDDINLLPILKKNVLRNRTSEFYTMPISHGVTSRTSGTTGSSIKSLMTINDTRKRMAYLDAYRATFGFNNIKMKRASMYGRSIIPSGQKEKVFWRDNIIIKQRLYSTQHLTPINIKYYVENLNRYRPEAIDGLPSSIYFLAKYINNKNFKISFKPKIVFTTGEILFDYQRNEIERTFKCKVSDQYASSEGAPFITQCEYGYYHEGITTGVFEHVPISFDRFKLIVTSFTSYGMPLIRYDIGDIISLKNTEDMIKCCCGSSNPIVASIDGRDMDSIFYYNMERVLQPQLSEMIEQLPKEIIKIQFLQKRAGIVDVNVVLKDLSNENDVLEETKKTLYLCGFYKMTNFKVHRVENILFERSGKYRVIKGMLNVNLC